MYQQIWDEQGIASYKYKIEKKKEKKREKGCLTAEQIQCETIKDEKKCTPRKSSQVVLMSIGSNTYDIFYKGKYFADI